MSRFSPEFISAVGEWVTHVAAWCEFRDWEIVLQDEPPDRKEAAAEVICEYGKKRAEVRLSWDFFEFKPDRQEHYLLHELMHIVNDPSLKVVDHSGLPDLLGMPAWTVFQENYRQAMEVVNDTWTVIVKGFFADGEKYRKLFDKIIKAERIANG
jgi:hypothetical protein